MSLLGGIREVKKLLQIQMNFNYNLNIISKFFCEEDKPIYITANPYTYTYLKEIRDKNKENPTEAELKLWNLLRNKSTGHKIRRQHIIGSFIVDFVCLEKKLIIEVDGEIHQFNRLKDKQRTEELEALSYKVIRFKNEEVLENPGDVIVKIKYHLNRI